MSSFHFRLTNFFHSFFHSIHSNTFWCCAVLWLMFISGNAGAIPINIFLTKLFFVCQPPEQSLISADHTKASAIHIVDPFRSFASPRPLQLLTPALCIPTLCNAVLCNPALRPLALRSPCPLLTCPSPPSPLSPCSGTPCPSHPNLASPFVAPPLVAPPLFAPTLFAPTLFAPPLYAPSPFAPTPIAFQLFAFYALRRLHLRPFEHLSTLFPQPFPFVISFLYPRYPSFPPFCRRSR